MKGIWGFRGLFAAVPFNSHGPIRWIARIIGLLVGMVFLAVSVGAWANEGETIDITSSGGGVLILSIWVFLSMLAFWRWERLSGLSTMLAGIALGIFTYVTALDNKAVAALTMGLPFMVIGCVFLFVSSTKRGHEATVDG